jgi:hypothetical protein
MADDDDAWQPEEDNSEEEEEEEEDHDVVDAKESSPPKQPLQPQRKRSRNAYEDTSERLTENGGYAHTVNSKLKISMANKGNTPWNKVRE